MSDSATPWTANIQDQTPFIYANSQLENMIQGKETLFTMSSLSRKK